METENTRRHFVQDAVKAVVAAGILVLIGLILTAGIFGANYGVRKASAQTKEQLEGMMDGYGLSEEQKEALYQEILMRLKAMLESGEIVYRGSFSEEDIIKLRSELREELVLELQSYISEAEFQKIISDVLKTLEQNKQSQEELLKQVTAVYEQYTETNNQNILELQSKLESSVEEIRREFDSQLKKEIVSLREKLSDQIRVHSAELEQLKKELEGQKQILETQKKEFGERFAIEEEKIGELLERMLKNEERMETVFQLVSNGKELLASAITDKGVSTEKDAAFETMAENIRKMADYQYKKGYESAPASISEFYLSLNFLDISGPLYGCGFSNYVTFNIGGADSVTIGSSKITVDGRDDKDFAKLNIQIALDGTPRYTIGDVTNYTIPTKGASTMTLRLFNSRGDERFQSTAVIRNLKLNYEKQSAGRSRMALASTAVSRAQTEREPEFAEGGMLITDAEGKVISLKELMQKAETLEQGEENEQVGKTVEPKQPQEEDAGRQDTEGTVEEERQDTGSQDIEEAVEDVNKPDVKINVEEEKKQTGVSENGI